MSTTDEAFDHALRGLHADALHGLAPATRAQLAHRRHAALRGPRARDRNGLRYALAGIAAASALALGLQLRPPPLPHGIADAQPTLAGLQAPSRPDTLLDEDPEFYAWLASSDARLVAME